MALLWIMMGVFAIWAAVFAAAFGAAYLMDRQRRR